jgi:hypothetical protein
MWALNQNDVIEFVDRFRAVRRANKKNYNITMTYLEAGVYNGQKLKEESDKELKEACDRFSDHFEKIYRNLKSADETHST